jgi:serine/threonine-protein kinase
MADTPTTIAPLGAGAVVGSYEIIGHIATGGMGEVYLARKRGLGGFERSVVLKVMLAHLAHDERFARMFVDEARIVSQLSHPNIVQVFDLDRAESGALYLAMEHLVGQSIAACLKQTAKMKREIPIPVAARIVCDAATGLAHAHGATDRRGEALGLVHRDISPENLFVTFAGPTKILDFGVAKVKNRLVKTQHGEFKGKLGYMAPEVIRGGQADPRTDLFALGVVFFELLTTRRLFHSANPANSLHRVLTQEVPDVRTLRAGVDEELATLVARLIEKDRSERADSAEELADRLERWLRTREGTSKDAGLWLRGTFPDAHALSARIAEGLEKTGAIDPADLVRARALGGEDLDDTLVKEIESGSARTSGLAELDGDAHTEAGWVRRARIGRWLFGLLLAGAAVAGGGLVVERAVEEARVRPPRIGMSVGGLEVEEAILDASGGSSYRVRARDGSGSMLLRLFPRVADPEALERALVEARSKLAPIGDDALPRIAEIGIDGGKVYYTVHWRDARPLGEVLDREIVTSQRGRRIVLEAALAIAHASEAGLVHGSLQPNDIWVDRQGHVLVTGFRMGYQVPEARAPGRYLAPELVRSVAAADPYADQYAVGVIAQDVLRTADQQATERSAPVVARATAVNPADRFRSNEVFYHALEKSLFPDRRQ